MDDAAERRSESASQHILLFLLLRKKMHRNACVQIAKKGKDLPQRY
jgi:hypothetical protein